MVVRFFSKRHEMKIITAHDERFIPPKFRSKNSSKFSTRPLTNAQRNKEKSVMRERKFFQRKARLEAISKLRVSSGPNSLFPCSPGASLVFTLPNSSSPTDTPTAAHFPKSWLAKCTNQTARATPAWRDCTVHTSGSRRVQYIYDTLGASLYETGEKKLKYTSIQKVEREEKKRSVYDFCGADSLTNGPL